MARETKKVGAKPATASALSAFAERFTKEMGTPFVVAPKPTLRYVSTGSLMLDAMIGTGGWPVGRVVELWGPESAGKTTMALLTAAQFQKADEKRAVAWIDMEHTLDPVWAAELGVDLDRLVVYTPLTAEDVADASRRFIESGLFSLVVLDSVGGMISRMEYEKEADEATVGQVPKIVTRMVKQAAPLGFRNDTTVLVINQVRAVIGGHGPTESTGGGWALKHVTSLKVHVRRGEPLRANVRGEQVTVGHQVISRIEKNKITGSLGRAQFLLVTQATKDRSIRGVDAVAETFDVAQKFGVLPRSAWVTLPDGERVNGRNKALDYLADKPEVVATLREQVLAAVRKGEADDAEPETGDVEFTAEELEG